jgi:hypothetical protein
MTIDHPFFRIQSRLDLPTYLKATGVQGDAVELGVLFGEYSEAFLQRWPGVLWMVDPWINQAPSIYTDGCNAVDMSKAKQQAQERVARFGGRAKIFQTFSDIAALGFADNSLATVFIDANHKHSAAAADIAAYWPKVRSGGVLAGHDFYERHDAYQDCGVMTAVQQFARANKLPVVLTEDTSWFILKP